LEVDDPIGQDELLQALFQSNVVPEAERDTFERLSPSSLHLSRLREAFRKKQSLQAIHYLSQRNKIKVDADLQVDPEDEHLLWRLKEHRLDYLLTVSSSIGLWAATPNTSVDPNFALNLDFKQPYRDFKGKYGKLGFDPKGRFLYIGKFRNDDVWLAMAPWSYIDGMANDVPAGHVTGDTRMTAAHYRMMVMFFAHVLSKIPDRPFTCDSPYGVSLTDARAHFTLYTNIWYVLNHTCLINFMHT
jgi:hypothetical protein